MRKGLTLLALCSLCSAYSLHAIGEIEEQRKETASEQSLSAAAEMPTSLPAPLPMEKGKEYAVKDYSSLFKMKELSRELIELHLKLYENYVKNSNKLLSSLEALRTSGRENDPAYGALKKLFRWEYNGMRLHEYYFDNLGGDGKLLESSLVYQLLAKEFGSYEKWKKDFLATGAIRGVGWAIVYFDPQQKRVFNAWVSDHDIGLLEGTYPLLVMDVWEHAFITQFGLDRTKYMQTFFDTINWKCVEERLQKIP